jgi:hypothetical protein
VPVELRDLLAQLKWWQQHSGNKSPFYAFFNWADADEESEALGHFFKPKDSIKFVCGIPGCKDKKS